MQNQKRFILITILNSILIFILIGTMILSLSSYTNSNLSNEYGYYYVDRIDSTFFVRYNSIFLLNNKKEKMWLLTERLFNKDTIYNSHEKFQRLKENSIIKIDLTKIDTLKCIKSTFKKHRVSGIEYEIDDYVVAWKNDTIKYNLYFSPQLLDVYIVKQK